MLAGTVGLTPDTWSHLPPEQEETNLLEFLRSLVDELDKKGLTLDDHFALIEAKNGLGGKDVVPFAQPRKRLP